MHFLYIIRIPEGVSDDCKDLIFKMLQKTPENRSTIIEILADKWFTKQDEKQNNRNQRPKATRYVNSFSWKRFQNSHHTYNLLKQLLFT